MMKKINCDRLGMRVTVSDVTTNSTVKNFIHNNFSLIMSSVSIIKAQILKKRLVSSQGVIFDMFE